MSDINTQKSTGNKDEVSRLQILSIPMFVVGVIIVWMGISSGFNFLEAEELSIGSLEKLMLATNYSRGMLTFAFIFFFIGGFLLTYDLLRKRL